MASPRAGNSLTLTVRRGTVLNQVLKQPSGRQTPLLARQRGGGGAGDWDTVLQSDRAGAADNAEDFTREFMSQLMGNTGANIPPPAANNKTPLMNRQSGPAVQTPVMTRQKGPGPVSRAGDWDTVLQANSAGAADNAEDFTREFMSQLMGNTGANPANTQNMTDNVTAPAQHSNGYQQQAVTMSTPTKQVRRGEIF